MPLEVAVENSYMAPLVHLLHWKAAEAEDLEHVHSHSTFCMVTSQLQPHCGDCRIVHEWRWTCSNICQYHLRSDAAVWASDVKEYPVCNFDYLSQLTQCHTLQVCWVRTWQLSWSQKWAFSSKTPSYMCISRTVRGNDQTHLRDNLLLSACSICVRARAFRWSLYCSCVSQTLTHSAPGSRKESRRFLSSLEE